MLGTSKSLASSVPNMSSIDLSISNEQPAIKRPKREDIVSLLMEEEGHSLDATSSSIVKNSTSNLTNKSK